MPSVMPPVRSASRRRSFGESTGDGARSGKLQVKVEALINLGRERGYVTYDEILREFPTR